MSDTPRGPAATTKVSLWETNSLTLKAERFFGYASQRSNGIVNCSGMLGA
jgi:hypothetical protein